MKNFYIFKYFEDLNVGDVFKFSFVIDDNMHNKFYTVYEKNEINTKFNSTYGKELNRMELSNNYIREIMIFPYRKK